MSEGTLALGDARRKEQGSKIGSDALMPLNSNFFYQSPLVDKYTCVLSRNNPQTANLFDGSQCRLTFLHQLCTMQNLT